ncbi:glycerol-3-phosphate dehydrogenase/oxidase [Chitinophaga lutea]|uniref:Glycerol-3-phosphate dehydrogenase/oxidase n=1 Tax=Chitinophaga lutea TaxID=2488634 RepID=A0A3N4PPK6_9BACT|nr:glycerol-3-phosphate dehydrogenase/oxidase [Chitinophaga lutea]RPE09675.1 glycerol-3-phosphate dehydrogenase/oxidase [Chitinophaga lutea]
MNRLEQLKAIGNGTEWDVLVIGGGATGLGAALEAATRGYKTLLLEQSDFAKSTSSKATKLLHGGVRYLAQGDVALVREASIERGLLLKNAQHLAKNLSFIIPAYSWWEGIFYTIGLKLYDWMAGRLSLGRSRHISRRETLEKLPGLKEDHLSAGILYHDGQFDDARLAVNLVQTIYEQGGIALNYMRVKGLEKNGNGELSYVTAQDTETGREYRIKTKGIINATGVFVDDILEMDDPGIKRKIVASQGVHLVLDASFLPGTNALMIPKTSDGRVLFAVPWHNKIVVGTTDNPVNEISLDPVAMEKEINFILNTAGQYLTRVPTRADVKSVWAGLRPLAKPEKSEKTKEISRNHKIMVSASGLVTILGGKWTTYRKMGEDVVDRLEKVKIWPHRPSVTRHLAIHGSAQKLSEADPLYFYGADAAAVKNLPGGGGVVSESLGIIKAQVLWAVRQEMAHSVEDVLARRTRALFLDAEEAVRVAPEVAGIMAAEMGKDAQWQEQQVRSFQRLAKTYQLQ